MGENQNKTVNMTGKKVKKEETKKISYEDLQKARAARRKAKKSKKELKEADDGKG
mgnify:CR=1 FL=1